MIERDKEWRYPLESQHLAGNPLVFGKDIDLLRRMAWESIMSTGVPVEYYRCCYETENLYRDKDCRWDDKEIIYGDFQDSPSVKFLKQIGWYNEDEEIRPPIIQLPVYKNWVTKELFDLRDNSLIKVHYFGQSEPAEFRITERKMDSVYGVYWICKLAPERLEQFAYITENGAHYLKRKEDRPEVCEHELNDTKEDTRVVQHGDYEKNLYEDYSSLVMGGIKK